MYPYYYYSHTQRGKLREQHLRTYLKAGIAYGRHVYKAAYYPGKHRYSSRYAAGAAPALIQKHGGRSRHKRTEKAVITAIYKAAALNGPTPEWHFIGRLQTNKVRLVDRVVSLWQSVDRAAPADRIAQRAPGAAVLVQVDLAGLAGRGGCPPEEVPGLVEHCRGRGLDVRGLMGVGPPGPAEDARPGFRLLTSIAEDLGLEERSMGMSGDLDVAIEAGSTMVRVGSALVGPRARR